MELYEKINIDKELTPERLIEVLNKIPDSLKDSNFLVNVRNQYPETLEVTVDESDSEESRYLKRKFGKPDYFLSLELR